MLVVVHSPRLVDTHLGIIGHFRHFYGTTGWYYIAIYNSLVFQIMKTCIKSGKLTLHVVTAKKNWGTRDWPLPPLLNITFFLQLCAGNHTAILKKKLRLETICDT